MYVLTANRNKTQEYLLLSNIIIIGPLILISPPATQISGPGLRLSHSKRQSGTQTQKQKSLKILKILKS